MNPSPVISVIVPAHRAAHYLGDTLGALQHSTLPRARWELIVVDDASPDATGDVAAAIADRVVRLAGRARGPGGARNAGAEVARGDWLLFIDADVRVHADTLATFLAATEAHPRAVAIFGAYDDRPAAPQLVSQYRNLLHRYVHLRGAGAADTFWAGCGGVRRAAFLDVGGFDTERFPRPQIEDIELGYRLRERGGEIILDPAIQGTHLKRWTLGSVLRTDILDRGVPWTRLLLERRGRAATSLNTSRLEQAKVGLTGLALTALVAVLFAGPPWLLAVALGALLLVSLANWQTHSWYLSLRGPAFALATVPLLLGYYASCAIAAGVGVLSHLATPARRGAAQ